MTATPTASPILFKIPAKSLLRAVRLAAQVARHRYNPILGYAILRVGSDLWDTPRLIASDLETSIEVFLGGALQLQEPQQSQVLLPIKPALEYLPSAQGEIVLEFDAVTGGLSLTDEAAGFITWQPPSAEEHPGPLEFDQPADQGWWANIRSCTLRTALNRTMAAADPHATRSALQSIRLEFDRADPHVHFVGADARWLNRVSPEVVYDRWQSIGDVPCKGLTQPTAALMSLPMTKLVLAATKGSGILAAGCTLAAGDTTLCVDTSDCRIVGKMVESRYPNWRQVCGAPYNDPGITYEVPVAPLLSAMELMSKRVTEEQCGAVFQLGDAEGLYITQTIGHEAVTKGVPAQITDRGQDPFRVLLDPRIVRKLLRTLGKKDYVLFTATHPGKPAFFWGSDWQSTIMPMRAQ